MADNVFPIFGVLTGASGSGKTAVAREIERRYADISVYYFDSIGVPTEEVMRSYGAGHQPGGAWQRAMTLAWIARLAPAVRTGQPVLLEGQMRIAFIQEALRAQGIEQVRILLLDCDDDTRTDRLTQHRLQPELAHFHMMEWARYLRGEAEELGCTILDTSKLSLDASVSSVMAMLGMRTEN